MNDQVTERRWSFNARADEYRQARPPYPPQVYEILAARCGLGPGRRVLEIGPGTGQATRELLARGADVVAVEPGAALAAHLPSSPSLRVIHSDLESADLPDDAFDLAVSATAFHWVRPEVARPKLARTLHAHGWLAVWWTVFGDPERPTAFRFALDELYGRQLPDERRGGHDVPGPLRVESWSAKLGHGGLFEVTDVELIRWEHRLTADGARRLFGSFPNVNELPDPRRGEFLDAIADLIDTRFGGAVMDPYVTALYLARRT